MKFNWNRVMRFGLVVVLAASLVLNAFWLWGKQQRRWLTMGRNQTIVAIFAGTNNGQGITLTLGGKTVILIRKEEPK